MSTIVTTQTPRVGTLERRSPLPAGKYWIDVFGLNIPKADNWFRVFRDLGVHIDATQTFPNTEVATTRNWYLFSYTPKLGVPVVWDTSLGYPTVADSSITSSDDTVQKPVELDPLDQLGNWLNSLEQKVGGSLGASAAIIPFAVVGGSLYIGYLLFSGSETYRKVSKRVRRISK